MEKAARASEERAEESSMGVAEVETAWGCSRSGGASVSAMLQGAAPEPRRHLSARTQRQQFVGDIF